MKKKKREKEWRKIWKDLLKDVKRQEKGIKLIKIMRIESRKETK